jgi:hypothetical protein
MAVEEFSAFVTLSAWALPSCAIPVSGVALTHEGKQAALSKKD